MKAEQANAWRKMSEEVIQGLSEDAKATFREIEDEVDKRLSALRAQMIADTAMQSVTVSWTDTAVALCPQCGARLAKKGKKKRRLQTAQEIELEREYGVRSAGCFFPLDEEIAAGETNAEGARTIDSSVGVDAVSPSNGVI
jgi:hypothetical protein